MKTLREWSEQLFQIYGERNECYFPSLLDRITHLTLRIQTLRRRIRRHETVERLEDALARVFARTIAISHHFTDIQLSEAMASKYGDGCSYCQKPCCVCLNSSRPEPSVKIPLTSQDIDLAEMTERLAATYGEKNRHEGIGWIMERLNEETAELISVHELMKQGGITVRDARWRFALELADVLA
jgi:hypothetical protein